MKKLPLLILFFGLAVTPVMKATPLSGAMAFGLTAAVGSKTVTNSGSDDWNTTPESLSVNITAFADQFEFPNPNGGGSGAQDFATTFGNGTASWSADGNAGSVQMNYGWLGDGPNGASYVRSDGGPYNWTYSFIADSDGLFVMDFAITATGRDPLGTFGLQGWILEQNFASSVGGPVFNAFNPTSSGQFVGQVSAGQTYTVSLVNGGNISGSIFLPTGAQASGSFDWSIRGNTVPDTTPSLALLGLGLAVIVSIRRKTG